MAPWRLFFVESSLKVTKTKLTEENARALNTELVDSDVFLICVAFCLHCVDFNGSIHKAAERDILTEQCRIEGQCCLNPVTNFVP